MITRTKTFLAVALSVCMLSAFLVPPAHVEAQRLQGRSKQVTASYTDNGDVELYEVDASSAAVTLTLRSPGRARRTVEVIKTDSSANAVTVATQGSSATINGASTYVLTAQHEGATFMANGLTGSSAAWRVVGTTVPGTSLQYAQVSLTNAEVLALRATPKTLVAAPGAGKILEFVSAQLLFDYTAAYTESADNMAVKYENGSGAAVSQTIECTGFVDATADTQTNALAKIDAIVAKTGSENKALVLHNTGDGEYGGGNAANVVRVKVAYRVHTTGW